MTRQIQRVGIVGGTFDPIHYGHLAAAAGAHHELSLDRVLFMPNRQPPHKQGQAVTDAADRLAMVRLAVRSDPRFEVSTFELEQDGPSYTVRTVSALREAHPDWDIYFIAGADSLYDIRTWYQYERLLQLCHFVAVARPGYPPEHWDQLRRELGPDLADQITRLDLPGVDLSASALRRRVREGAPITYLLPPEVEEYVKRHGLYREQEGEGSAEDAVRG